MIDVHFVLQVGKKMHGPFSTPQEAADYFAAEFVRFPIPEWSILPLYQPSTPMKESLAPL